MTTRDVAKGRAGARSARRERGRDIRVTTTTFYRAESAQGRDLGVLAALTTRRRLEVLDATCASGARAARYAEAGVLKSMHANDVNADVEDVVRENLAELLSPASEVDVKLTFDDAQRVFARAWLEKTFYDVVDVDGFGAANFGDALKCVKYGGLFYATSTDARALCGQNPETLSRAFGNAVVAPSRPGVNEIALRVFIGDVVRRGAAIGISATPLFSLFHPHGPVFRVMFRVEKARGGAYDAFASNRDAAMGFVGFCDRCGDTSVVRAPLIDVYGHTKTIAPGDDDATTPVREMSRRGIRRRHAKRRARDFGTALVTIAARSRHRAGDDRGGGRAGLVRRRRRIRLRTGERTAITARFARRVCGRSRRRARAHASPSSHG